jgi:hypothetical protein
MSYPGSDTRSALHSLSSTTVADDKQPPWPDETDFQIDTVNLKVVIHEAAAISDFPEGGLRAWSVVFGVRATRILKWILVN